MAKQPKLWAAGLICFAGFVASVLIISTSNLKIVLEDAEEGEPTQYYTTAFPPGQRKGVGPGLSFGDPVLNKYNKFRFVLPCVKKGNCPSDKDTSYLDWKNLKQYSPTTDEQLGHELDFLASDLESQKKVCEDGFAGYDDDVKRCSDKATRKTCYKYEALAHICEESADRQINSLEGTKYFDSKFLLKSCASDSRKTLTDTCKEAEKLPGVNVQHWPWQGHMTDDI
eukprot:CAMPEP_0113705340 /NCGR_PEP_ID=MMETSP0038_2-20120614/27082_1 /TAXON_ID=2898 /ORGANISM="Cryptomonas paramecium" /LENGTH=225 /DNA_ID=CAMNT_0000630345 /DNA_START=13 /DNA_END=690 /DNA_ORIENTATION=- /assembly_acc=CAM_ASM_000170